VIGVFLGYWIGLSLGGTADSGIAASELFQSGNLWLTLVIAPFVAPILTGIASWVPALLAAQQDPADVLQGA
jgi:ABC-type lipoprotein release transport system permease subunit